MYTHAEIQLIIEGYKEEQEYLSLRIARMVQLLLEVHKKKNSKSIDMFEVFDMPILKKQYEKQQTTSQENQILSMFKQGLIKEDHKIYGKTLERLKKEGKL